MEPHAVAILADDDKLHEECGVFGVWNIADAAALTALGLHALQHRGQEATGIVTCDGARFHSHRGLGLVGDNFGDARVIATLPGSSAVGHNRYATTGDTVLRNVQPLYADFEFGGFAVAHNGNLTNAHALRRALVRRGCLFQSTTDSRGVHPPDRDQPLLHRGGPADRCAEAGGRRLFAGRAVQRGADRRARSAGRAAADPRARHGADGGWVLASRDLRAGYRRRRVRARRRAGRDRRDRRCTACAASSRSAASGSGSACSNTSISRARIRSWRARRSTTRASASAPSWRARATCRPTWSCRCRIPACRRRWATPRRAACRSSSASSATTMSAAPSSSRPTTSAISACKLKHSANRAVLEGQARGAGGRFHRARHDQPQDRGDGARRPGAAEVHMRISSPPTTHSCFYGIDTPERGKLLAARYSVDGDGEADRRGQPGVHLDRRALPRARQAGPRRRARRSSATPASPAIIPSR